MIKKMIVGALIIGIAAFFLIFLREIINKMAEYALQPIVKAWESFVNTLTPPLLWMVFVTFSVLLMAGSLIHIPQLKHKPEAKKAELKGPVRDWLIDTSPTKGIQHPGSVLNRRLETLAVKIFAYRWQVDLQVARQRLQNYDPAIPTEIQHYLLSTLDTPPKSENFIKKWFHFWKQPSQKAIKPEIVIQFLEEQMEKHYGNPRSV